MSGCSQMEQDAPHTSLLSARVPDIPLRLIMFSIVPTCVFGCWPHIEVRKYLRSHLAFMSCFNIKNRWHLCVLKAYRHHIVSAVNLLLSTLLFHCSVFNVSSRTLPKTWNLTFRPLEGGRNKLLTPNCHHFLSWYGLLLASSRLWTHTADVEQH